MANLDIAVIMSTYSERPEWLRASIESILRQTYPHFRFYIVLDNPKNDELNSIVREYADQDARITVVENESNLGAVASRNRAIFLSKESYIAIMDADDISYSDRLQEELGFLIDRDLDFVAAGAEILSNDEVVPGRCFPDLLPGAMQRIEGFTNIAFHSTWLLKREIYEALEGYRDTTYCEDYDFLLRAIQSGYRVGRLSRSVLRYRFAEGGLSYSNWIAQEKDAMTLQRRYCKGKPLSEITKEEINRAAEGITDKTRLQYENAKKDYDELFVALSQRKIATSCRIAIEGLFGNKIFRKKVRDSLRDRAMIPWICWRYNK